MGWTYTCVTAPVDRKKECDSYWNNPLDHFEVLKSAMRGRTWYAAVRDKLTGAVFGAVTLTDVRKGAPDGFNFGTKEMTESVGPCEDDCPLGILKLLTPTEYPYAKEWRERCYAKYKRKPMAKPKEQTPSLFSL